MNWYAFAEEAKKRNIEHINVHTPLKGIKMLKRLK